MTKVTYGQLKEAARDEGIEPDRQYEDLREAVGVKQCKHCGDEFVVGYGYSDKFCSDTCEVEYIHEHYR